MQASNRDKFVFGAIILSLLLALPALGASAESSAAEQMPYRHLLDVERDENWLQAELRKHRSFPHLDRAYQLLNQGQRPQALEEIRSFLRFDPEELSVRVMYFTLLYEEKQFADVISQASVVLEKQPLLVTAHLYRGYSHQHLGQVDQALQDFSAALDLRDTEPAHRRQALQAVAHLALRQQRYAQALAALNELAKKEQSFTVHIQRANALRGLGRLSQAATALTQAIDRAHGRSQKLQGYLALAQVDEKRKDWPSAETSLRAALALDAGNIQILESLLRLNRVQKKSQATVQAIHALLAQDLERSRRAQLLLELGWSRQAAGKGRLALSAFEKADTAQRSAKTLLALAGAHENLGQLLQAIEARRLLQKRRPSGRNGLALGILWARKGQPRKALQSLQKTLANKLTGPQRAQVHQARALLLEKLGEPARALQAYRQALKFRPRDPQLLFAVGELALQTKDNQTAIRAIEKGLRRQARPQALRALALAYQRTNRVDDAIDTYDRLGQTLPGDLMQVAQLTFQKRQYQQAAELFVQAHQRKPDEWAWLLMAGRSHAMGGHWSSTIEVLEPLLLAAKATDLQQSQAAELSGYAAAKLGRFERARDLLEKALARGQDRPQIHQDLGFVFYQLGQWQQAVAHFRAAKKGKQDPWSEVYLSRCYGRSGKTGLAVDHLQNALSRLDDLEPGQRRQLLDELGHLYFAQPNYSKAEAAWTRAQALGSTPALNFQLARVRLKLLEPERARQALLATDPALLTIDLRVERFLELAYIATQEKQHPSAVSLLTEALAIRPDARLYSLLSNNQSALGQTAAARKTLEQAISLRPGNDADQIALAYLELREGQDAAAADRFETVLKKSPDRLGLAPELAYARLRLGDNEQADVWFSRAIDNEPLRLAMAPTKADEITRSTETMRSELRALRNRFDVSAYWTYTSDEREWVTRSGNVFSGAVASQAGLELAYQPPAIGFNNHRIFQVYARALWNMQAGSLAVEGESFQGGAGLRYQPFAQVNWMLAAEGLFRLGEQGINDLLLRSGWAWGLGLQPVWEQAISNYTSLYIELDYFTFQQTLALYAQARQGFHLPLGRSWAITPHLLAAANARTPDEGRLSALEAGAGLSFQYHFARDRYEGHQAHLELWLQYKLGTLIDPPADLADARFQGLFITGLFRI